MAGVSPVVSHGHIEGNSSVNALVGALDKSWALALRKEFDLPYFKDLAAFVLGERAACVRVVIVALRWLSVTGTLMCVCVWLCGCVAVWLCGCVCVCGRFTVLPPADKVFAAFNATPLHAVRVVVLGQCPYHHVGEVRLCGPAHPVMHP